MQPHHSFIDIDAINDLIEDYPIDDTALQVRFDKYSDDVNKFIDSVKLDDMVTTIGAAIIGESTKVDPKIILKLSRKWNRKTIGHLLKLIKYLFDEEAKCVTIKKFLQGSICIEFLVSSNRSVKSLIVKSQAKLHFLHLLGIFQLIIDNQTIIDRDEDASFIFEESLLESIVSIESNLEYHKLSLLLIELEIELNYQNTNGKNALMLTSEGGHIEVFESLLLNGADPFVQLPANKGCIGLNSLACTALSEHIYKSIGGEKIMPQDGISVEDMLDMAVKERGVCSSSYDSFICVIKNNLKERFQLLENCLHALSSNFIDTATYILTSESLVRDARQNFPFYIKEDATYKNVNQLLQLLQPHYSYLNINLLTILCTITEPIKEQVEDYNANLKIFKDTTSLLELAMITKGMQVQYPDGVLCCSKLILRLNKPWCSRTITELNKAEIFYFQDIAFYLTLQDIHCGTSSLICTYLLPQSYTDTLVKAPLEQRLLLCKIGVFEVIVNDIVVMKEEEDKSFTFEAALQEAYQNNNTKVLFFLSELNISLPLQNDNTKLMIACMRGDFVTVQLLLGKNPNVNAQKDDGQTPLMCASSNGHLQIVEVLLSKHPDINIQNNDGLTALIFASHYGYHEVVKLLLSKDPDINIQNKNGWTALMVASRYGHHQVVELLLSKNPDINIHKNRGCTALMFASGNGHHHVVELLLSKNPDINIQSAGHTALMFASRNGHHQVVELLLSKDPDINIESHDGWTALMYASRYGHYQVVRLLLSKDPDINIQDNDGSTALFYASTNGHHKVIELLLSKDPDINLQNNDGSTALIDASADGHHKVIQLLLSKDPDINLQNNDGSTALMMASANGQHEVVQLLLSKDPDINILDNDGWTALMSASYHGHQQVVELLLSKDPDINVQNNDGFTVLMIASANGQHRVVELLLSKDPDINTQSYDGWTALMNASRYGHHQIIELLLSKNPDIFIRNNDGFTALMLSCICGHHQIVELLLSKDSDINAQFNGYTALILASGNGHCQVVELLMSKSPDMNVQDNDGFTALMTASYFGHYQVVELLLSKDPNINIQSNDGETALLSASSNGHYQVVELLLHKNPDINIQNKNGLTALMAASAYGHHQIVELLLSKNSDVDIQDNNGLSALTYALVCSSTSILSILKFEMPDYDQSIQIHNSMQSGNYAKIIKLLLDSHANHNHFNSILEPLHSLDIAALFNNFAAMTVLIEKCDITSENIINAFTWACYGGHSSMIIYMSENISLSCNERKLLVAAAEGDLDTLSSMVNEVGTSPNTPLVAGMTPLMIAASCGHIELVKTLIQTGADVNKTNERGENALDIVSGIECYDRSDVKQLLIAKTPAGKPDSSKKKNIQPSIKSLSAIFISFIKNAYNRYNAKQQEMKTLSEVTGQGTTKLSNDK
ncbi:PREDICTED: serine/threonine-protein phosphatase 6 regulatory ankyrin repeat subunit B-like [Amphimedon queenslandica]|nr:PREDICTED: serine/threonine-protein phosphatase 6 regulatory ankyrin repeat subunit B-like [Amphimedon queenslandica]|eukprot:XP_019852240.1 PREDICTED: serine/threonine-protein phosphatase 6 regulatory ankyrin repeat subunit B-like [Amphimedon queenslandica]